jgi:hypothetical protein
MIIQTVPISWTMDVHKPSFFSKHATPSHVPFILFLLFASSHLPFTSLRTPSYGHKRFLIILHTLITVLSSYLECTLSQVEIFVFP